MSEYTCLKCGKTFDPKGKKYCDGCGMLIGTAPKNSRRYKRSTKPKSDHSDEEDRKNSTRPVPSPAKTESPPEKEAEREEQKKDDTPKELLIQDNPSDTYDATEEGSSPEPAGYEEDYTPDGDLDTEDEPVIDEPDVTTDTQELAAKEHTAAETNGVKTEQNVETATSDKDNLQTGQSESIQKPAEEPARKTTESVKSSIDKKIKGIVKPDTKEKAGSEKPQKEKNIFRKILAIPEPMKLEPKQAKTDFNEDGYYDDVESKDVYETVAIEKGKILKILFWIILGLLFIYAMMYRVA